MNAPHELTYLEELAHRLAGRKPRMRPMDRETHDAVRELCRAKGATDTDEAEPCKLCAGEGAIPQCQRDDTECTCHGLARTDCEVRCPHCEGSRHEPC